MCFISKGRKTSTIQYMEIMIISFTRTLVFGYTPTDEINVCIIEILNIQYIVKKAKYQVYLTQK